MISIVLVPTTSATEPIAFTTELNTNSNIVAKGTGIQLEVPGIYEIVGAATVTSTTAGNYGLSVYANGEETATPFVNLATGASEVTTVPIYAVVQIAKSNTTGFATITFVPTGTPTIVAGVASIKRLV